MILSEIDIGPGPSDEDLAPYLKGSADDVSRLLAELEWRRDLRRRDPDAFLVAFSFEAFPALGFANYKEYLRSPLWRRIKIEELHKVQGQCAACGGATRTIHHRDYRPRVLRGDDRSALIALCTPCHDKIHNKGCLRTNNEWSWNDGERLLRKLVCARDALTIAQSRQA